jgi:thiamine biosynthesis lipoprotein
MNKLWFLLLFLMACGYKADYSLIHNFGFAQGTTYSIKYMSNQDNDYQISIDSIFSEIDSSLSTYVPYSLISKLNNGARDLVLDSHFLAVFNASVMVSDKSNGAIDCTINPLIELWGFGSSDTIDVSDLEVKKAQQYTGYQQVSVYDSTLLMPDNFSLNFNALAQGYTVDVIAQFLESKKINNFLIEVGGELRASGKNSKSNWWKVGIDKPQQKPDPSDRFQVVLELENKSLATSGNYRNFYIKDGQIYSHTIDPIKGYPVNHTLLSATVVANSCMLSDAYATAFMVMGVDSVKSFLKQNKDLDAFLVYGQNQLWKTWASPGFEQRIID